VAVTRFAAVVISGASRGLGAALARRFAAPGVRLLLVARSAEALADVAADCRARGADVAVAALDVRDAAALAAALAEFEARGPVDLAVANAGTSAGTAPDGSPEAGEAAAMQVAVNLLGAMHLVGPLLPGMLARGCGAIGLVASVAAFRGLPDMPGYCASKAGLLAWGEALRAAHGPAGIKVSVICPGFFDSAMGERLAGPKPLRLGLEAAAERTHRALLRGEARAGR
jgi:short-subunit dehydrogenase